MPSTDNPEVLARYIINGKHYRPSDHTVKHNAFLPNKDGKTSVFQIFWLEEQEIWEIGDREVAPSRGPILARADIDQIKVTSKSLRVIPSEPPDRHADIMGWPNEKDEKLSIALDLAEDSHLMMKP